MWLKKKLSFEIYVYLICVFKELEWKNLAQQNKNSFEIIFNLQNIEI